MSRGQPAGVPSRARDAVVAPDMVRFAIQKIDRLHLTRMEERHEEIAHRADVLHVEDQTVRRGLGNAHSVGGRAGEIIGLFQVERLAGLHLIGREVLAAGVGLEPVSA